MESKEKKRKRSKPKLKKPKVYISSYKIIGVCVAVIAVCMGLLIVTNTVSKKNDSEKKEIPSIAERFEDTEKSKAPEKIIESPQYKNQKNTEKKLKTEKEPVKEPVKETVVKKSESAENQNVQKEKSQNQPKTSETVIEVAPEKKTADKKVTEKKEAKKSFDFPAAKKNAQLVFVFDDGGQNLNHLEKFMDLPFPFTVAVLPCLGHSVETARRVRESGNEVILHQPMLALSNVNPGPGAITPEMTESEVRHTLLQNINEIAPIEGVNNHEGSAITADLEKMAVVLQTVADCGIYYLDSRTNVETVVPYLAKEMGYHYYERNIFLDNEKTRENILSELKNGLTIANKNGVVIMIGHVWSAEILPAVLKEVYPELKAKGYSFSVVSKSNARK